MKPQSEVRRVTVAIKEEEQPASGAPAGAMLRPAASEEPARGVLRSVAPQTVPQTPKKVLHPNVDIDALKRAITESLKKPGESGAATTSHDEKNKENIRRDVDSVPVRPVARNDPSQRPANAVPSEHINMLSSRDERRQGTMIEGPMSYGNGRGGISPETVLNPSPENINRDDGRSTVPTSSNPPRTEDRKVSDGKGGAYHQAGAVPHVGPKRESGPKIDMTMLRKAIGDVQKKQGEQKSGEAPLA